MHLLCHALLWARHANIHAPICDHADHVTRLCIHMLELVPLPQQIQSCWGVVHQGLQTMELQTGLCFSVCTCRGLALPYLDLQGGIQICSVSGFLAWLKVSMFELLLQFYC